MTADEAKDYIREWCPYDKQDEIIKALSDSDEDCISRKDVEMCLTANITDMTIEEYISMVGDRLKELPSTQPKPKTDVLDKIRAEIKEAADKQFQIAMGVTDLNERYTHIQMENAYRHSLNIIDKYKTESEDNE